MPIRKVTEKLDDNLHISDFAIKGDGSNVSKDIFDALVEVYKKNDDAQFFRDVFFPAGTYVYDMVNENVNIPYFTPFPLVSNLHVHGEGIDRTILDNHTTNTLLSCIDDEFNAEYGDDGYGNGDMPSNILIEDVTFSGAAPELARLIGCFNVTFNRVKFSGDDTNTLITIAGNASSFANNIVFNECQFENAACAIDIQEYAENVTINNCKFKNIGVSTVKVGNNNAQNNVRAITISGCHFEDIVGTSGEVISLGENCKYTSVTNCTFDDAIIEKEANHPVPYKDNGAPQGEYNPSQSYSIGDKCVYEHKFYVATDGTTEDFDTNVWTEFQRYNYTDILDITTDDKKLLRFKFAQPRWEYINYLVNGNGEVALIVDGKDSDITASNGLNIVEDANGIDIRSVKDGSVTLSMDAEKDLELGKPTEDMSWTQDTQYAVNDEVLVNGIIYKCVTAHTSGTSFADDIDNWQEKSRTQIIIDKILQLNDHMISNKDGSGDIIVEPATDKIIEIQQTSDSVENYEDKIVNRPNAVPNVAFVKNYSTSSLIKHITFEDMADVDGNGNLLIGEFPLDQYGENIHITGVTVNVRNPFYKVIPYMTPDSADYYAGYEYYQGDVVKGTVSGATTYATILRTHIAENSNVVDNDNMKIISNTYTRDIKSIDVIGKTGEGQENSLVKTCSNSYDGLNNEVIGNINLVNIQNNNLFGYTSTEEFDSTKQYGDVKRIVKFQDRNYILSTKDDDTLYTITSTDLHNVDDESTQKRMYDEGYIYSFDEDRNFNIGTVGNENPYSVNYAGGKVYVKLYDSDDTLVTSSNVSTKLLNPAGDMIVKIDFVKEEL